VFGSLFSSFMSIDRSVDGAVGFTASLSGIKLDEYNEEHAGLADLLSEAVLAISGQVVHVSIDFAALARGEDETPGQNLPRRDRSSQH
jgi:hypothetical protein